MILNELQYIVDQHNKERRHDRENSLALKAKIETEAPFRWGQNFDIEPEVWDEFDGNYA